MNWVRLAVLVAASLSSVVPASETVAADQVATVEHGDPAKFFLFHLNGVSKDQARADLVYCIGHSRGILSMRDRQPSGGGLLGGLLNARMAEIDRFRMRNAAMRKCMGMIGYDRYLIPEAEWKAIVNEGDIIVGNKNVPEAQVVERMVDFAAGATPAGERLPR